MEVIITVSVIIAAGGKGTRMGADMNKVYLKLLGEEILLHTVKAFENTAAVDEIIVVTGADDTEHCHRLLKDCSKVKNIIQGGNTRQQSVYNGLSAAAGDIVLIHDGARALITEEIITNVINDCIKYGAASAGVPVKDTLKSAENGFITGTIDRERAYQIQTPQAFCSDTIKAAHKDALKNGYDFTDDCQAAERLGVKIKIADGSYENIKITTPEDIVTAERILEKRKSK